MVEKLKLHEFKPQRANRFACEECPYLANNPVHVRGFKADATYIKGVARPNKTG